MLTHNPSRAVKQTSCCSPELWGRLRLWFPRSGTRSWAVRAEWSADAPSRAGGAPWVTGQRLLGQQPKLGALPGASWARSAPCAGKGNSAYWDCAASSLQSQGSPTGKVFLVHNVDLAHRSIQWVCYTLTCGSKLTGSSSYNKLGESFCF